MHVFTTGNLENLFNLTTRKHTKQKSTITDLNYPTSGKQLALRNLIFRLLNSTFVYAQHHTKNLTLHK